MTAPESIKPLWSTTAQVAVFLSDNSDGQPLRIGDRCTFTLDGPGKAGQLFAPDVERLG
jgi:hypothetical protein